jgi:hypothetical protein
VGGVHPIIAADMRRQVVPRGRVASLPHAAELFGIVCVYVAFIPRTVELPMDPHVLVSAIGFNTRAMHLNLEGLTHEDCLLQPPSGNCINWLLGHILRHRNLMLEALAAPSVWSAEAQRRYDRGSAPIRGEESVVVALEVLRWELDRSGEHLSSALAEVDVEAIQASSGTSSLGQRLVFLALHEAYHMGQVGLLRRLAGKEGAIG